MEPKSSPLESAPGGAPRSPEFQPSPDRQFEVPSFNPERQETAPQEQAPREPAQAQPVPITLPTPQPIQTDDTQAADGQSSSPQAAGDEDVIEKEWVDQAKKIISETKDDPFAREQQVSKLQAEYLRKRYGKELGTS